MANSSFNPDTNPLDQMEEWAGEDLTGNILVVDDEGATRTMLQSLLESMGHEAKCFDGADAAEEFMDSEPFWVDVVLTDLRMPGRDGISLIAAVRTKFPDVVPILGTGYASLENALDAMRTGVFDLIGKPFDIKNLELMLARAIQHRKILQENRAYKERMEELVVARESELVQMGKDLAKSYQFMLESLVALLEAREPETGQHTKRVTLMSVALGDHLGITGEDREILRKGAALHDIGKIAIPDAILLKAGPLNDAEWAVMKTHVVAGYDILKTNPALVEVAEIVRCHHEHFNGSGYPRGLSGEDIVLGARIFSVVDAYDAIRAKRPYSKANTAEETLREIVRCRGSQFDPGVVDVLANHHEELDAIWRDAGSLWDATLASKEDYE